ISPDGRWVLGKNAVVRPAYPPVLAWSPGAAFPAAVPWAALALANQKSAPAAGLYRSARVWDMTNGKVVSSVLSHPLPLRFAVFSPDGQRVVTVSEPVADRIKLWLWSIQTGRLIAPAFEYPSSLNYLLFSPDGKLLVTVGGRGLLGDGD